MEHRYEIVAGRRGRVVPARGDAAGPGGDGGHRHRPALQPAVRQRVHGPLPGVPGDTGRFIGQSVLSIGFAAGDQDKLTRLAQCVLHGRPWEGTFASAGEEGSSMLIRAYAVPLRHSSGAIDGISIFAREAARARWRNDGSGRWKCIGERLGGSLELGATLRHVTDMLVPQFADHCFIDLFQGDTLVRRVQTNAGGWEPPRGAWTPVGEQVRYPEGHFCQQAMARSEIVVVTDLQEENFPAPSADSLRASYDVGMISVIALPLHARGELLGVMSLALSGLTTNAGDMAPTTATCSARSPAGSRSPSTTRRCSRRSGIRPSCSRRACCPRPFRSWTASRWPAATCRRTAEDPRAGNPDPGRRRLVRRHPAGRRAGGHRHRGR